MKYPKEFEKYWTRSDASNYGYDSYDAASRKGIAYNAWKAGRRYQKKPMK